MNNKAVSFSKHEFSRVNVTDLYRQSISINKMTPDYTILSASVFANEENRAEIAEREIIEAYLHAAQNLANEHHLRAQNLYSMGILNAIYKDAPAMPVIYMIRHVMELSIKRAIAQAGQEPPRIHNLNELFAKFRTVFTNPNEDNDRMLNDLNEFVEAIAKIDDTGTKLRYASNGNGFTQNETTWINEMAVVTKATEFVHQLESIEIE